MREVFALRVTWPSGRVVPVDVTIEPLAGSESEEVQEGALSVEWIDGGTLMSRQTLDEFLESLTRVVGAGESANALCLETDQSRLYQLLDYEAGQPQPVDVKLPTHG